MQVKREESTPTQSIWDNLLDLFLVKVGRIYNVAPKSKCPRSGSLQGHWNDHVQPDAGLAAEEGSEGSERSGDRGIDRQMERIRCHSYQHPWSAPGFLRLGLGDKGRAFPREGVVAVRHGFCARAKGARLDIDEGRVHVLKRPGFDGVIDYPEGSSDYGSTSQVPG